MHACRGDRHSKQCPKAGPKSLIRRPLDRSPRCVSRQVRKKRNTRIAAEAKRDASIVPEFRVDGSGVSIVCICLHSLGELSPQWQGAIQLQLQYLTRQSRAIHKGARGSWGARNKTLTHQNAIKSSCWIAGGVGESL
jgi:hypothetical protein